MIQQKIQAGRFRKTALVGTGLLALTLSSKTMAEVPATSKPAIKPATTVRLFYQARRDSGHEAGVELGTALRMGSSTLGLGLGVAGNLASGSLYLETASVNLTFPLFSSLTSTAYIQQSRFLGGQTAAGGVLHLGLNPITVHAGAEWDFVSRAVPLFVGAEGEAGPMGISAMAIMPFVPGQTHPNLGGAIKLNWKTRITTFFARVFGMLNPRNGQVLAGNVQIGVEMPLQ